MRTVIFLAGIFLALFFSGRIHAQTQRDFSTNIISTYTLQENGNAQVTHEVSIENLTDFLYFPSFSMHLEGVVQEASVVDENLSKIDFQIEKGARQRLTVLFPNKNAGKGRARRFAIQYEVEKLGIQKGSVREVSIPGLKNTSIIDDHLVRVEIPESWNNPGIIKPSSFKKYGINTFEFAYKDTLKSGVLMIFGDAQYYKIQLAYHLKNPNIFPAEREIAIPSNNSYQQVLVKKVEPFPDSIHVDDDGNWLARFLIPPGEEKNVKVEIYAKVGLGSEEKLNESQKKKYTRQDVFWEKNDENIKKTASKLSGPREIVQYVVDTLEYDYEKPDSDSKRYGARDALVSPKAAVCLEFSDLFIALARAKGIPARSVEGFAYSTDQDLRPLSLIQDVLHAWPEYYDEKMQRWIMIDPTWTDTTGGLDYFSSLDFDHISFVKKGISSRYPIPAGAYKEAKENRDIDVQFIKKEDFLDQAHLEITPIIPNLLLPFFSREIELRLKNIGDSSIKPGNVLIESDFLKNSVKAKVPEIPPKGEATIRTSIEVRSFLTKRTDTITMRFEGQVVAIPVTVSSYPSLSSIVILGVICGITSTGIIIAFKTRHIFVHRKKR